MNHSKPYSAHSGTEYEDCDTLEEAESIAQSMCLHFKESYIVDNNKNVVIKVYLNNPL
jgi:hypothetical protein